MTLLWPPDYKAEWERRARLVNRCREDSTFRASLEVFYRDHPIEFIEDWCVTFDPRRPAMRLMPFILFPRQREFITFLVSCWRDRENGLCEKARDMGVTWEACVFSAWLWRFWPGSVVGWGSLKAEQVDKQGDPKAIFPKIRQTIEYWPRFLRPRGYAPNVHATYMKIINPENDSAIIGESGDNMGRGGRTSIYFKDESAHYEHPEQTEAALGDNTDVQIDISSVNGPNNVFFRRRFAGEVWYPDQKPVAGKVRVFIFDWSDHPLKTKEWHEARERRAEAEGLLHVFRQEVDRNYASSQERTIIRPEWIDAAVDAHIALGFTDDGERVAGQDVADGGADKNALAIKHGVVLKYAEAWGGDAGEAAKIALTPCKELGVDELYYDCIGIGAGFKAEMNNQQGYPGFPQNLRVMRWNAGAKVLDPTENIIPGDDNSPTNENQYVNLKAQAWFRLRGRFYRTFKAVRHGEKYDAGDLISLPSSLDRLHEIKMQLCQATHSPDKKGKTLVDKKPDGATSPNLADAIVMAYSPTRELSIYDVL